MASTDEYEKRGDEEYMDCIYPEIGAASTPACNETIAMVDENNNTESDEYPVEPDRSGRAHEGHCKEERGDEKNMEEGEYEMFIVHLFLIGNDISNWYLL